MPISRPTPEQAETQLRERLSEAGVTAPSDIRVAGGELRARWEDEPLSIAIAIDPGMPR